jgi:hypothetical protein
MNNCLMRLAWSSDKPSLNSCRYFSKSCAWSCSTLEIPSLRITKFYATAKAAVSRTAFLVRLLLLRGREVGNCLDFLK